MHANTTHPTRNTTRDNKHVSHSGRAPRTSVTQRARGLCRRGVVLARCTQRAVGRARETERARGTRVLCGGGGPLGGVVPWRRRTVTGCCHCRADATTVPPSGALPRALVRGHAVGGAKATSDTRGAGCRSLGTPGASRTRACRPSNEDTACSTGSAFMTLGGTSCAMRGVPHT
jgi:hypothetical protein